MIAQRKGRKQRPKSPEAQQFYKDNPTSRYFRSTDWVPMDDA